MNTLRASTQRAVMVAPVPDGLLLDHNSAASSAMQKVRRLFPGISKLVCAAIAAILFFILSQGYLPDHAIAQSGGAGKPLLAPTVTPAEVALAPEAMPKGDIEPGIVGSIAVVNVQTANLRAGAGTNSEILGQVTRGTTVKVIDSNSDQTWYLVEVMDGSERGTSAWINADLVVPASQGDTGINQEIVPIATGQLDISDSEIAAGDTVRVIKSGGASIYMSPPETLGAGAVGTIRLGDEITVLGATESTDAYILVEEPAFGVAVWIKRTDVKLVKKSAPPVAEQQMNAGNATQESVEQQVPYEVVTVVEAEKIARGYLAKEFNVPIVSMKLEAGKATEGYQEFNGRFALDIENNSQLAASFEQIKSTGDFSASVHLVEANGARKVLIVYANEKYGNSVATSVFSGSDRLRQLGIRAHSNVIMACRGNVQACKDSITAVFINGTAVVDSSVQAIMINLARGIPAKEFSPQSNGLFTAPDGAMTDAFGSDGLGGPMVRPAGVITGEGTKSAVAAFGSADDSNRFYQTVRRFEEARKSGASTEELQSIVDGIVSDAANLDFAFALAQLKADKVLGQNPVMKRSEGSRLVLGLLNYHDVPGWSQRFYSQFMELVAILRINMVNYQMEMPPIEIVGLDGSSQIFTSVVEFSMFYDSKPLNELLKYRFTFEGKSYDAVGIHLAVSNFGPFGPQSDATQ